MAMMYANYTLLTFAPFQKPNGALMAHVGPIIGHLCSFAPLRRLYALKGGRNKQTALAQSAPAPGGNGAMAQAVLRCTQRG